MKDFYDDQRTEMQWILVKTILTLGVLWILWVLVTSGSNYNARMEHINKRQCAVWGYEEDCKTPLPPERRLK